MVGPHIFGFQPVMDFSIFNSAAASSLRVSFSMEERKSVTLTAVTFVLVALPM